MSRSLVIALGLVCCSAPALGEPMTFRLPVACEVGRTCEIQNYVDGDPSPAARDHQCGSLTYDGHDGTDIRLPTLAAQRAGVDVVAPAGGRVLRVRDGVADASIRDPKGPKTDGRECGNGAVLDHGDGWETQYCHMARGSLRVKPGDTVEPGAPIGQVGLSGTTEFPHLHFTIRHDGKPVDPFAFGAPPASCGRGTSLWETALRDKLAYKPRTVLNAGFMAGPASEQAIDSGEAERQKPRPDGPALVAYVRVIGARAGDVQMLAIKDSLGRTVAENSIAPLDRNKAQYFMFVGRKTPQGGWPSGAYEATYTISNGGSVLLEKRFGVKLQ